MIEVYGADWCGDCKRAKSALEALGIEYVWHDLEKEEDAADKAVAISGQMHIPVVVYPDGTFQVEPSSTDIGEKTQALNLPGR